MKNEEAKFILGAYRPNGSDAGDETLSEALRQAQTDPELREWFGRTQAFDSAVAAKLAGLNPPPGLRESILAGSRVSGARRTGWWSATRITAVAAAVVIIMASLALWPGHAVAAGDSLAEFALNDVARGDHNGHGKGVAALQVALSDRTKHLSRGLSLDFAGLRTTGCRTVSVAGAEVFEVCFNRDGSWYHLYVTKDRASWSNSPREPVMAQKGKRSCASWTDTDTGYHYAVVGDRREAVASLL
jgi:hypothetical protein